MITRETIKQEILALKGNNFLLELPTGIGKTKLAIDKAKQLNTKKGNILIVVPRLVLIDSWKKELNKWWKNYNEDLNKIEFTTYNSFYKYAETNWDIVIFDEAHHISENTRLQISKFNFKNSILCSATIKRDIKAQLIKVFPHLVIYKQSLRNVINDNILPDPKVILIKLELDNKKPKETIKLSGKGTPITISYDERWHYLKNKLAANIKCTETQYYEYISNNIDYWKNRYLRDNLSISKNNWLRKSGERLKWLSNRKSDLVLFILKKLNNHRTITFCNSILHTEILGKYCINSTNKKAITYLSDFNSKKINHITTCNMLNEGANLVDCQIGIYASLNSSEIVIIQKMGRLLRHKNPIIIIPYYNNTRDQEIVEKMIKDYNPKLITTIENLNELQV